MTARSIDLALAAYGYRDSGIPYSQLDCKSFVERCLRDIGVRVSWRGSNYMWRNVLSWKGTPEECVAKFGSVPTGALVFILKDDGGERARGYYDDEGNASHVGIVTNMGKGAMHSSSSRGGVCESEFKGKTIKNGGWNRVGLLACLDYGEKFETAGSAPVEPEPVQPAQPAQQEAGGFSDGERPMEVYDPSGGNGKVYFRMRPSKSAGWYGRLACGTRVTAIGESGEWTKVRYDGRTGWMMSMYLRDAGASYDGFNVDKIDTSVTHDAFTIVTTAPNVRVRSTPYINGTANVVRLVARKGTELRTVGRDAETGWYLLTDGNYICGDFVAEK